MAVERQFAFSRVAVRLMMAAGAAALMAGCSDASRFSDPFTNPFSGSSPKIDRGVDGTPTASISAPRASAPAALPGRVESKPLPATSAPVAQAPVAPAAPVAAAGGAGASHWTANGGTPITVASGETAAALATRYGVPTDALLHANGYTSAAQVQPGSRLIIPVYRAGAVAAAASAPVAAPAPAAPAKVIAAAAKPDPKIAAAPAKPDPKAAAAEKAKAEQAAKLAREEEARQKKAEADKVAAEKAAQAKKLADAKQIEAKKAAEAKAAEAKAAAEKAKAAKAEAGKRADAAAKAEAAKAAKEAKLAQAEAAKAVKEAKSAEQAATAATATVEKAQPKAAAAAEKPVETASAAPSPQIDKTTTASIPPAESAKMDATKVSTGGDPDRPEFRWPAHGRIIQGFSSGGNDGINIAVPEGTPVKAAEGGTVAYAGSELKGYGNLVLIRHPNGYVTAYAHNGQLDVKRGDSVKRGQTIAKSGQTGNVGSPQLHFELRKGAQPIDPTSYLAGL